ncbi:MAG: aminotransferase class I/II-fold pyridoxal phosphate-dependent enzyme, partial [Verrucomicrobiota bacterium]
YICGSRALIDYLVNRARSFIFSTAPVPAASASATAGVRFAQSSQGELRRKMLWERVGQFKSLINRDPTPFSSASLPIVIGDEAQSLATAAALRERGLFVPAIRYPTVARGAARLRVTLTAAHEPADVSELAEALRFASHASRLT